MSACGFTGYRFEKLPFSRRDQAAIDTLKQRMYEACVRAVDAGCTRFISGFAQGSDLLFAETVIELGAEYEGIRLEAALPFQDQDRLWTLSDRRQFQGLLKSCNVVRILQNEYSPGCYHKRNDFILKSCDRLIAVFDPSDTRRGGTAYTVSRAIKLEKTIDLIIP